MEEPNFHESMVRRYYSRRRLRCRRDDPRGNGPADAFGVADGIRVADACNDDATVIRDAAERLPRALSITCG
jgi:hypothetical protein